MPHPAMSDSPNSESESEKLTYSFSFIPCHKKYSQSDYRKPLYTRQYYTQPSNHVVHMFTTCRSPIDCIGNWFSHGIVMKPSLVVSHLLFQCSWYSHAFIASMYRIRFWRASFSIPESLLYRVSNVPSGLPRTVSTINEIKKYTYRIQRKHR